MKTITRYPKVGNWHEFESFCWFEQPDDADDFCIYHLKHRDSGLLEQSNASVIQKALEVIISQCLFEDDALFQTFNHWVVGWTDIVAIRVTGPDEKQTEAYKTLCKIIDRLSECPVLDEEDWWDREHKATLKNIEDSFFQVVDLVDRNKLPEDWACCALLWFSDHCEDAIENTDDQGGYPNGDQLLACISSLWPEAINAEGTNTSGRYYPPY